MGSAARSSVDVLRHPVTEAIKNSLNHAQGSTSMRHNFTLA